MRPRQTLATGAPPPAVLDTFGLHGAPVALRGGEGRTWRVGDAVLKPCDVPIEWEWLAERLSTVPQDGFRLAPALRAADGRWVVDGWCAQGAVAGNHPFAARWGDVLAVCERLHLRLSDLPEPTFLHRKSNPWSIGDRVAWAESEPAPHPALQRLVEARRPLHLQSQLVHGDVTENVLFAEGLDPAIIDFSPYWRPAGFASAVVVADALCWHGADVTELLEAVRHIDAFPQLLLRALIYRMTTTIEASRGKADLGGYLATAEIALDLAVHARDPSD